MKSYEVEINFYKKYSKNIIINNLKNTLNKCEIASNFGLEYIENDGEK